ncbi:OsmC family protein [Lacicoccus alkaliphilus]|uniref:Putative redox protein n=1 Tax=Lacicoccus alkaliphilus DSM 16010 TaxID=1123231 RepID=A0A1M7IF06_9BACL|nr:OsmC family protein [Salinicoccus alkaliphilus]SHM39362.1 putative redox protein [Salinicoccus alkaliphilus DSM 16010]
MKVNAKWQGDISFESTADVSGHTVKMDARKEAGGSGSAPSPMEMVLHGVAGCMGIDMCVIMRHHMDKVENLELELDGTRAEIEPKRFTDVVITVSVDGDVPAKILNRTVRLSHEKYCSAVNSLNADFTVKAVLNGEEI